MDIYAVNKWIEAAFKRPRSQYSLWLKKWKLKLSLNIRSATEEQYVNFTFNDLLSKPQLPKL